MRLNSRNICTKSSSNIAIALHIIAEALESLQQLSIDLKSVLTLVNQLREKIGRMFGKLETITSGRALGLYS
ncbi:hypothetical protein [Clostridium tertium]|uniref:hypothetical protein n=1 Tax=Clostridium tertium TaxID=1559 RepID=UPI0012E70FDF